MPAPNSRAVEPPLRAAAMPDKAATPALAANGSATAGEASVFVLTLTAKDENGQPLPARDSARVKVWWQLGGVACAKVCAGWGGMRDGCGWTAVAPVVRIHTAELLGPCSVCHVILPLVQGIAAATTMPDELAETVIPQLPYNATAPVSASDVHCC